MLELDKGRVRLFVWSNLVYETWEREFFRCSNGWKEKRKEKEFKGKLTSLLYPSRGLSAS